MAAPPNLVFIIADDCTYLDMEVYGGQAKTLKQELSNKLDTWMTSQGDQGAATEEIAHTRKASARKRKNNQQTKKMKRRDK